MSGTESAGCAGPARHALAVLLLPFMNTVVVPAGILAATGGFDIEWLRTPSAGDVAVLVLAGACLAAGAALVAHAIALFVRVGGGTLAPWDPTRRLVLDGAYRYSRNPMKAGLFLVLIAEAALLRSTALLAWFAVFALANAVYIRMSEEPGLRARFGPAYDDYCARVPRWLPNAASIRALARRREAA